MTRTPAGKSERFGLMLFLSGLFGAASIASLPFFVSFLNTKGAAYTEVLFPLVLVAGVVALILVMAVLIGLFKRMGLTNEVHALGLPSGSISAIIALMLILVFAMLSVLIQANIGYDLRNIPDLTPEQANQIAGTDILGKTCTTTTTSATGATQETFCTVVRKVDKSPATVDIGKQLVTTVSTLVVAISAFYFGSAQTASVARGLAGTSGAVAGAVLGSAGDEHVTKSTGTPIADRDPDNGKREGTAPGEDKGG
ncbi:MAG TPA: hypothetical protein VJ777_22750 [Mycobacterium sp.]|nr:hypothetical protein [Mycobacterium sp.]